MCISRQHLDFMDGVNERHFRAGRIGEETHQRFQNHAAICRTCVLFDNGEQGDIYDECRVRILRYFVSAKRDDIVHLTALQRPGKPVGKHA